MHACLSAVFFLHLVAKIQSDLLYTWGENSNGALADGSPTTTTRYSPTLTATNQSFVSIVSGRITGGAITSDGRLYMWGANSYGQLGDATTTARNVPVPISITGQTVAQVSMSHAHTGAVTTSGKLYMWGSNQNGCLGDGTWSDSLVPIEISVEGNLIGIVAAGGQHTLVATAAAGQVYAWGYNNDGMLGDGTSDTKGSPSFVNLNNVRSLQAGWSHSGAITTANQLYMWGMNDNGQVGDGTTARRHVPTLITISGQVIVKFALGMGVSSAAVTQSGLLYMWGYNGNSEIDSTGLDHPSPVLKDTTGITIASIAMGHSHIAILTPNGELYTWGANGKGQLGNGTCCTNRATPGRVSIPGKVITAVAMGNAHSILLSEGQCTFGINTLMANSAYVSKMVCGTAQQMLQQLAAYNCTKDEECGTIVCEKNIPAAVKNQLDTSCAGGP